MPKIIYSNRIIETEAALKLSKFFGNSATFWLGLMVDFDIEDEKA